MVSFAVMFLTACKKDGQKDPEAVVFAANGDINTELNEFRNKLGTLNTTPGATSGRREINWDAIADAQTGIQLPGDFFNATGAGAPVTRQRGLIYAGTHEAMVSKNSFENINANASSEFSSFSGDKSFAVVDAPEWPVEFRVAGQITPAVVNGMGIVFCDVDKPSSTFLEFFNDGISLGKFFVPAHDAGSKFSFLGVYFPNQKITSVKVGHEGKLADGEKDISNGGTKDLVIMDDFIYSEPVAK